MSTKAEPAIDTGSLTGDAKTLKIANERLKYCINALDRIHRDALEDLMFYDGQQWPEDQLRQRNDEKRPSETINKTPSFVHQVTNDMRQNRPQLKIRPTNNVTAADQAEVINGLIRSIMQNGDAKSAIDTASFYQVVCGFGYVRILTKYQGKENNDQEIYIGRVDNSFTVYAPLDLINEVDYSDMPYCFLKTRISKDVFAELYPDSDMTTYNSAGVGEDYWIGGDFIVIAEYFERVCEYETLYELSNHEFTKDPARVKEAKAQGLTVEKEREVENYKIIWRKITENEILEEQEFPGQYIPIVPFLGQSINVNGEKKLIGIVRNLKAPQRMYNYAFNAWIEIMALQPKSPYVAAEGQIEGYEEIWKTANAKNHAYLPYKAVTEAGNLLPPPQRNNPPEGGSSLFKGIELGSEQMKEVSGIYDASLGAQGNESSGKAIIARQREGDTGNYHFMDNQSASIKHIGRILIDLIPEVYDAPRAIRILGDDMTDKVVEINKLGKDGKLYDMSVGEYDVVVDVGPDYQTKRVETAENLMNIMKSNPALATPIMDLFYRSLDFTYASEAADRMKKLIQNQYPGMIADDSVQGGEPTEQQVQAMVQDMQKLMQAHQMTMRENQMMQQQIQALNTALKSKADELQVKADGQVLRAQSEAHKADVGLKQTALQMAGDLHKHAIDTAVAVQPVQAPQQRWPVQQAYAPNAQPAEYPIGGNQ